jgi:mono/diheme cytochrome c family protein
LTEVPEHLLRRSRERREALGLLPKSGESQESAGESPELASGAAASSAVAPVAGGAPLAKVAPEPPRYTGPAQLPKRRNLVPMWIAPILAALPVWAFFYVGALGARPLAGPVDPVERGNQIFHTAGCSGCHGAQGQGGVGPKLAGGEAVKTFPNEADHITWVTGGSIGTSTTNKPYGDPKREGGQHVSKGGMPAFGSTLSSEEIADVVAYEREGL